MVPRSHEVGIVLYRVHPRILSPAQDASPIMRKNAGAADMTAREFHGCSNVGGYGCMNALVNALARLGLFKQNLDLHVVRVAMVIMFFFNE
jgi:hypothetical protein